MILPPATRANALVVPSSACPNSPGASA